MLFSITTTHQPATDLGYLLGKHPERLQSFGLAYGDAHVFYPEATEAQCTACLLLDIDPVGLVRNHRRGPEDATLAQYVNDRPYVASSFMSVAIARVFSGALANGSYGSAQAQNAAGADRLSFNNLLLSPAQLLGEVPTLTSGTAVRTFNNAQLTLAVSGGPGTIADQLLAGIDPTDFTSSATLSVFLSYTQQPGGTAGPQGFPAVSFNYNLQPVSTTQVPVPAAAWLLGSGLLSLAGIARRRRTLQG